ncbi:MAG TPA: universal stress protein [Gemmatimonadaceae bacterium]|jgi:nucleotide-binding universal stress UspA family protein
MRLDRIAIGMDFSPTAIATAEWVATSLAPDASITLVHAIEPPARPPFLVANTLPAAVLETDARALAEQRLREIAQTIGRGDMGMEVRVGRAHEVIERVAMDTDADLIAVGPHGNREHESLLLGTTADSLARAAATPVLVGARASMHGRTRVVAALVESHVKAHVLSWADLAARALGGRLTALHVLEPAVYSHIASLAAAHAHGDASVEQTEIEEEMRRETVHWLRTCASSGVDVSRVEPLVEHGQAAEAILAYAAREKAALIVLGRHRAVPGAPALLGRTVRHVLHEARCAVLLVPVREA